MPTPALIASFAQERLGCVTEIWVMPKNQADILVVGEDGPFEGILNHLEGQENYCIHYLPHDRAAQSHLADDDPDAILLTLGGTYEDVTASLDKLDSMKSAAPVVVISPCEEAYLPAMNRGAFDFLTPCAPVDEVDRVLEDALAWKPFPVV